MTLISDHYHCCWEHITGRFHAQSTYCNSDRIIAYQAKRLLVSNSLGLLSTLTAPRLHPSHTSTPWPPTRKPALAHCTSYSTGLASQGVESSSDLPSKPPVYLTKTQPTSPKMVCKHCHNAAHHRTNPPTPHDLW